MAFHDPISNIYQQLEVLRRRVEELEKRGIELEKKVEILTDLVNLRRDD